MAESAVWKLDPEHSDESVRALAECINAKSSSVLLRAGDTWLPLLGVEDDRVIVQEWDETVDAICVRGGDRSTTFYFLDDVEPGLVRLTHDKGVDGLVLAVGGRPILACAGVKMSKLPDGLLHLDAKKLSLQLIEDASKQVGKTLLSLDVGGGTLADQTSISFVGGFESLQALDCNGFTLLADLAVGKLTQLRRLNLGGCVSLCDVTSLSALAGLTHLDLSGCARISGLSSVSNLYELVSLNLSGCSGVDSLDPLCELPLLMFLGLAKCAELPDLSVLANAASLESLDLSGCTCLTSVEALGGCTELRTLLIGGCTNIHDVDALVGCTNLRSFEHDDDVLASRLLIRCAVLRKDAEYVEQHADIWLGLYDRDVVRSGYAEDLFSGFALGLESASPTDSPADWVVRSVETLIDCMKRLRVEDRTAWSKAFAVLRAIDDPDWCKGVERALEDLERAGDVLSILRPAMELFASAHGDHPGAAWARVMADATLDGLIDGPSARAVAPVAVKYYSKADYPNALDQWVDVLNDVEAPKPRVSLLPGAVSAVSAASTLSTAGDGADEAGSVDASAAVGLFAELASKQPAGPVVSQVVSILVGMAQDHDGCAAVEPFAQYFSEEIRNRPGSAVVGRLWDAFDLVLRDRSDSLVVDGMLSSLLEYVRRHPQHPVTGQLMQELMDLSISEPDNPSVSRLVELLDAARDSGVVSFARSVLDHPALCEKASSGLDVYVGEFGLRRARAAMIRGILLELVEVGVISGEQIGDITAAVEGVS